MIHRPLWSGTKHTWSHATHTHRMTFSSAKLPYTPSLLVPDTWCLLAWMSCSGPFMDQLILQVFAYVSLLSGPFLVLTSLPRLHYGMNFHQVRPQYPAFTPISALVYFKWSYLPTCLSDLNSRVNFIIRKTCMNVFFKQMKYSWSLNSMGVNSAGPPISRFFP